MSSIFIALTDSPFYSTQLTVSISADPMISLSAAGKLMVTGIVTSPVYANAMLLMYKILKDAVHTGYLYKGL